MRKQTVLALLIGIATVAHAPARAETSGEDEARAEIARIAAAQRSAMARSVGEGGEGFGGLGLGMFLAASGDVASTEWGLRQPGVYEANPIMKNRGVRIGTHVIVPTVVWWASKELHRNGQRRLAWVMRLGVVAAYGYATLHNFRTISGVK